MGRHSAPDDDDVADDSAAASSAVLTAEGTALGRHSQRHDPENSGQRGDRPSPSPLVGSTTQRPDDASTQQIARTPAPPSGEAPTGPIWRARPPASAHDALLDLDTPVDLPDADDDFLPGGFTPETVAGQPAQPTKKAKRPRSGDLTLVRRHSDVRARVIAAVIVPFIVYFAVQIAIGSTGRQMLLFIFIPLIIAGVLVGTFLDIGHKKYAPPPANPNGSTHQPGAGGGEPGAPNWQQLPAHWNQHVSWPGRDEPAGEGPAAEGHADGDSENGQSGHDQ